MFKIYLVCITWLFQLLLYSHKIKSYTFCLENALPDTILKDSVSPPSTELIALSDKYINQHLHHAVTATSFYL